MKYTCLLIAVCMAFLNVATPTAAQDPGFFAKLPCAYDDLPLESQELLATIPDAYGIGASFTTIPVTELQPLNSDRDRYENASAGYRFSTNGGGSAYYAYGVGPTQGIPIGSWIFSICVASRDSISDGEVKVSMWGFEHAQVNSDVVADHQYGATATTGVAATPGWGFICTNPVVTLITNGDINNDADENWVSYYFLVELTKADPGLLYGSGWVWWNRQISPAPATATFNDVPTNHWAFQHIEALTASGITSGCGTNIFCPDATLTRAQMAVFLAKALGLHWNL